MCLHCSGYEKAQRRKKEADSQWSRFRKYSAWRVCLHLRSISLTLLKVLFLAASVPLASCLPHPALMAVQPVASIAADMGEDACACSSIIDACA